MLRLEHITVIFNKGTAGAVKALQDVSLSINNEEFLVVVGSNGSGKSTLMNVVAGSQAINTGKVIIDGNDVSAQPDFKRAQYISRLFQNPLSGTAPELSIIDNLRLAAHRTQLKGLSTGVNAAFRKQAAEKLLLLGMGLENKMDQPVGSLSGGQRQALTLVMAIMDNSKLLLMDEPAAALDPKSSQMLMQQADIIIKEHKLTAILITHNLKDAYQYGNRLIIMSEGKIVKDIQGAEKTALKPEGLFELIG